MTTIRVALFVCLGLVSLLLPEAEACRRHRRRHCYSACYRPCIAYQPGPIVPNTLNDVPNPGERSRGVHCVFVLGTTDRLIASQVTTGGRDVIALFDTPGLREKVLSRKIIHGKDATPENILAACDAIQSGSNDTIFVYYHGHGGVDKEDGHTLLPVLERGADGAPVEDSLIGLPRSRVVDSLSQKAHKFICFVTDSCSDKVDTQEYAAAPPPRDPSRPPPVPSVVSLMLDNKGILDINSSTYDVENDLYERAWVTKRGGIFTRAFIELAQGSTVDVNGDGKVGWVKEFLPMLKANTERGFQLAKDSPEALASDATILNQEHQTVQQFAHN